VLSLTPTKSSINVGGRSSIPLSRVQAKATLQSYLLGAMHDGTVRARTLRISQREQDYVLSLMRRIIAVGGRAWVYKEGKERDVYVVEFSRTFLDGHQVRTKQDVIHYVRGYFDAEGGIAASSSVASYLYFAQKDRSDLHEVQMFLRKLGISCGRIHNPSARVDPDYWRFYVSRRSLHVFAQVVGSWHPRKSKLLAGFSRIAPRRARRT